MRCKCKSYFSFNDVSVLDVNCHHFYSGAKIFGNKVLLQNIWQTRMGWWDSLIRTKKEMWNFQSSIDIIFVLTTRNFTARKTPHYALYLTWITKTECKRCNFGLFFCCVCAICWQQYFCIVLYFSFVPDTKICWLLLDTL